MRRWWVSKHVGGSKLSKKSVPYGTILFERLKGLLRKIDPAYVFLKIDIMLFVDCEKNSGLKTETALE